MRRQEAFLSGKGRLEDTGGGRALRPCCGRTDGVGPDPARGCLGHGIGAGEAHQRVWALPLGRRPVHTAYLEAAAPRAPRIDPTPANVGAQWR